MAEINIAMELELEAGEVIFSVGAQKHAQRRHPDDYPKCLPHCGVIVTAPLFVGDDHRNPGNIELISRVASLGTGVLVAVCIKPDHLRKYGVASLYPISENKIQNRLTRGFLKRLPRL